MFPLFYEKWAAWVFLPLRLWLGWQWVESGWGKLFNPAWMETGMALKGYWAKAVVLTDGKGPIAYDWYRSFLQSMLNVQAYSWFSKLIVFGELLVGVGLIVGAFVGVAAFFGALMNWSFMMAGTAGVNPMFFVIAIFLVLGWRVAGYIGADYFILNWKTYLYKDRRK